MNPYAILGVSSNASAHEIKSAYRRLVKQYHPDRQTSDASHDQIAAINHAYDILSDPIRRAQYDRGFSTIFIEQPEDPVEVYKREFKRKRFENDKREREEKLARRTRIYRIVRWIHMPITAFMVALLLHELFTTGGTTFFRCALLFNAGYVCYYKDYREGTYKLSFFNLFIFVIFFLVWWDNL
ncbi:J domain-containing protein [Pseudochryseolinea flava]|uniref:J domain-containing protein n=1 Tax=Pseudochryseolinea flava TaxID=2059302 RepID=A0A364Y7V5_9BACT|nr:DnaJ domain-containing protein [Pseudochryseolinea flava]RAW02214.1 hypothetical protein DQQ10_06640 [Pseudochryseolinea flava]